MTKVAIIGAGAMGQALAHILKANKTVAVSFFDSDPTKSSGSLEEVLTGARIVFLCIPSWAMRQAADAARPHIQKDAVIVSLAKGLDEESKDTMDSLLKKTLPQHSIAVLGGPMLAKEFMENHPGVGMLATENNKDGETIAQIFSGTVLSLETTKDARGVAWAGVLKNIYALGLGIGSGLSWGNNEKGWFVTRALSEMADLIELFCGKRETAYSLSGIGDLVATGLSSYSRNSRFGEEVARTGVCSIKSEGRASMPLVAALLAGQEQKDSFPLFFALEKVIIRGANAKAIFEQLMR